MKKYVITTVVEVDDDFKEDFPDLTVEAFISREVNWMQGDWMGIIQNQTDVQGRWFTREDFIKEFVKKITPCYDDPDVDFNMHSGCVAGNWFSIEHDCNTGELYVRSYGTYEDWVNGDEDDGLGGGIIMYRNPANFREECYREQAEFALDLIDGTANVPIKPEDKKPTTTVSEDDWDD